MRDPHKELPGRHRGPGSLEPLRPCEINDPGVIVGDSPFAFILTPVIDPTTGRKAWCVPGPNGANQLARALPGNQAGGSDINAAGVMVGSFLATTGYRHAAVWKADAGGNWSLTDLGLMGKLTTAGAPSTC